MNKLQRANQRQLWLSRISDLADSGLTQTMWCSQKNLPLSTLRYWLSKLREPEEESQKWLCVDLPEGKNIATLPQATEDTYDARIKISCGPYTVEFPSGCSRTVMADVLQLVREL
jgi:hypothetical protein